MHDRARLLLIPLCLCLLLVTIRAEGRLGQAQAAAESSAAPQSRASPQELPRSSRCSTRLRSSSAKAGIERQPNFSVRPKPRLQIRRQSIIILATHCGSKISGARRARNCRSALELDPKNVYTIYFLARISQSRGESGDAIRRYESVLRLGSPIYDTSQRLGQLYFDHGDLAKAREQIEAALKQTPWDSSLYYQLGKIDQRSGHAAAAREEFASAERLKNASQEAVQSLLALNQALSNGETGQIDELAHAGAGTGVARP